ncbi:MAG: hypothetical protein A2008_10220 [Candidatus Wallbacteria bacterium GWC2_49_35]|uniref:MalT-like TPR region domain-containing protein n=1 Tax=Candidatus Wallbacteria bacterium GWC2_49_35 TaxID=1817813 RepID=A0A1F7WYY1_9BACT|nr:MAG: hypothetical protein A2008_10220 [Candidatus Wallbacteria bacterium GWC2_49_35]HBC76346.1 hypothetical protein [Candidatus Wallbacteria bacterium]
MHKKFLFAALILALTMFTAAPASALSDAEFDAGVKKANELYAEGEDSKCFSHLKQLEIRARKSNVQNYVRLLVYMMRLSSELGFEAEVKRIKSEIDSKLRGIKDEQYLKNLHMAVSAIYANSNSFKEAGEEIKKSLRRGEAVENLFTYAMIMAKFGERGEAYKTLDRIFKLNNKGGEKNEEIIMNNMTAAVIAMSFEDFTRAREHIDAVMQALAKTSDAGYFVYIYKSLLNNIFSYFEYNPLNLRYYEKMYAMAKQKGGREDAGTIALKIAKVLSDLGLYKQSARRLDEAAELLGLGSIKLDDEARIKELSSDTLEQINRIANIFIDCANYDAASKLLEDLIFIYEKKGSLKDSFEKIRALALCKFRQNSPIWKNLTEELLKTCGELKDTRELILTRNFLGELLLETGEVTEAEKILRALADETEKIIKDDAAAGPDFAELYLTLGHNLALARIKSNDAEGAVKIIDSYLGFYEIYKARKKNLNDKKRKSGDSLTNFTVVVEFSVSDAAEVAGKLYFMKAKILFDKEEYENANKLIAIAFDLLKNTDHAKNFYEILNFIVANEDKFKDKKLFNKFRVIREQYDEIIKSARTEEASDNYENTEKSEKTEKH